MTTPPPFDPPPFNPPPSDPPPSDPPSAPPPNLPPPNFSTSVTPSPASGHPVQLSVAQNENPSRLLAIFSIPFFLIRSILLIPAFIVLYFVGIVMFIVAWIAQIAVAFTGNYPEGMRRFVAGSLQWQTRASAYLLGLTDKYPPFSLS
ncbi:DUF4389 domain-containing protein [Jatrophihabitans sp. DSM 45814]